MQIALTKKLADAIGIKPDAASETADPFFSWTANWTNTFDRRKEDMIVMVNNATRFTVTIYGVKRNQFKGIADKMIVAIRNTLLAMNINPKVVDAYLAEAGDIVFSANKDRQLTAWVNRCCLDAAFAVGRRVIESAGKIKHDDAFGRMVSLHPVGYGSDPAERFIPSEKMVESLVERTGKPAYHYRAFELLVTLDLEIYKAVRRVIVPADLEFTRLHTVLQNVFGWKDCHLHDFAVFDGKAHEPVVRLVSSEEELSYDDTALLMSGHRLSEFLSGNKRILYTYDMGDNWEHEIELVRIIEEHHEESPYLLEATGQTPPEDVGGVGGFIDFRSIMLDPGHPEYKEMKDWSGYWSPELREWERRPRVIHC